MKGHAMSTLQIPLDSCKHVYLEDVTWDDYEALLKKAADRPIRFTYDNGRLEIMTMSFEHGWATGIIGRLIGLLGIALGIPFQSADSVTMKRRLKKKGLETDDCFWFQHEKQIRGHKKRLDLEIDPPPDLALEVEVSRTVIKRMKIYAALKVPELWRFKSSQLLAYLLQSDDSYKISEYSKVLPFLATAELQPWIEKGASMDQATLGQEFIAWAQKELKPRMNGGRKNGKRAR